LPRTGRMGNRQAQQGNQKEPARVKVKAASGYSRLYPCDESACFSKTFRTRVRELMSSAGLGG
jgi:hypothetical protein